MKKSAWTFILAAAMLLAGCASPEKPPRPAEELLEQLPATPDMAVSSDEKVLPELMKSAAAATTARYMDSGYRILQQEDTGLARDVLVFCDGSVFYCIETDLDAYTGDWNNTFVPALASDGKTQTNINASGTGQGQLAVVNVFERDPVYNGTPKDMMARPLAETISCNGLEIMEAYPSSFTAWKETGTDENGTPTVTVHWMIPDRDGLTTTLSGSRFSNTGNIFPVENDFSFTLKREGEDWILQNWSTGSGTGTVTDQGLEADEAFWTDCFGNPPAVGEILTLPE